MNSEMCTKRTMNYKILVANMKKASRKLHFTTGTSKRAANLI